MDNQTAGLLIEVDHLLRRTDALEKTVQSLHEDSVVRKSTYNFFKTWHKIVIIVIGLIAAIELQQSTPLKISLPISSQKK